MICQRCGYCCIEFDVPVIAGGRVLYKEGGYRCPHLSFDKAGEASCAIHGEKWYPETPCFNYANPDVDPDFAIRRDRPCSYGQTFKGKLATRGKSCTLAELKVLQTSEDAACDLVSIFKGEVTHLRFDG
jgi:hypothetical protein